MGYQTGGTKTISKITGRIVKLDDGKTLLNAIVQCIQKVQILSVGSLCAMVARFDFDPTKMVEYELRSEEIAESGKVIDPTHVSDPAHGKIHNSVVLKISVVQKHGGMLNDYTDSEGSHEKATVTLEDTNAEWKGQEYIHAMLRSGSGVSPCPDAIANVKYTASDFYTFCTDIKGHLDLESKNVFDYLIEQISIVGYRSIDILIMDTVLGKPLSNIQNSVVRTDMSKHCCAIFATVVAKTGFVAADAHDKNWLIDLFKQIRSMIDFGRGSYLLAISSMAKLMAGLERWLNPLPQERRKTVNQIKLLWTCLGEVAPETLTMSWSQWVIGFVYDAANKVHREKITIETTLMMQGVLDKFIADLKIGDPTCPAFIVSAANDARRVCKNLHRLFVLSALCGGLFHAVDYGGQTPIQFQAVTYAYTPNTRHCFKTFDSIITHLNIDLDVFEGMYGLQPGLTDVCRYMQPLIKDNSFTAPPKILDLPNPYGVDGAIEEKRKAAIAAAAIDEKRKAAIAAAAIDEKREAAIAAATIAANKSIQRHHKTHKQLDKKLIDSDLAVMNSVSPARTQSHSPLKKSHRGTHSHSSPQNSPLEIYPPKKSPPKSQTQRPNSPNNNNINKRGRRANIFEPLNVKQIKITHVRGGSRRRKCRTTRTKYRRQKRHTRKLRN